MRIEYRTYPAQRKPAINDRQHTKLRGERVRLPDVSGWGWFSFVDVVEKGYGYLLSAEELYIARFVKDMSDVLMFGLPNVEATHFTGLAARGVEVRVAKPTTYFTKVGK